MTKSAASSRLKWIIFIIASISILGGLAWYLYSSQTKQSSVSLPDTQLQVNPQPLPEQPVDTPDSAPPAQKLTLPGSSSIDLAPGDPRSDDHIWRLVNKSQAFTNLSYIPPDLVVASLPSRGSRQIRQIIEADLTQMFSDARNQGINLLVGSAYRSYNEQVGLYSNYVRTDGQAAADRYSARPGHSEHQSGLTVDLTTTDYACYLEQCFADTAAGKWLAANAASYGFILRYSDGKEEVTGYMFEPWHFRYVGRDLARALTQSGQTLDQVWPAIIEAY